MEPRSPAPDVVVTIRASRGLPALCSSRQYPIAWRTGQNSPRRCTRITASHSSTDMFTIIRSRTMPALHTTVSRPPNVVDRLRDQPTGAVPVADVVAVDDRLAAGGLDLGDDLRARRLVGGVTLQRRTEVVHHDLGALRPRTRGSVPAPAHGRRRSRSPPARRRSPWVGQPLALAVRAWRRRPRRARRCCRSGCRARTARFQNRCASTSHVNPMPPCTWMPDLPLARAASPAMILADRRRAGRIVVAPAVERARPRRTPRHVRPRPARACRRSRCLTAWNEPITRPNCSRSLAYAVASSVGAQREPELERRW